jgi:uncharacterized protein (DUF1778 family)
MASRKTDESEINGNSRTAHLGARITPEQKNPFIKVAARIVREREAMTLSTHDRQVFVAALLKAPAPGPRLHKAARRYKKQVGK